MIPRSIYETSSDIFSVRAKGKTANSSIIIIELYYLCCF